METDEEEDRDYSRDPQPQYIPIGQRLAQAREATGRLRQEDLAKIAGVSKDTYRKWEQGRRMGNFVKVGKVAAAMGISLDWLIGLTNQMWPIEPGTYLIDLDAYNDITSGASTKTIRKHFDRTSGRVVVAVPVPKTYDIVEPAEAKTMQQEVDAALRKRLPDIVQEDDDPV